MYAQKSLLLAQIAELEEKAKQKIKNQHVRKMDYVSVLPEGLRDRVAKIMPYLYYDYDENVFIEDKTAPPVKATAAVELEPEIDEDAPRKKRIQEDFNESTCSLIENMEAEFVHCNLKLEKQAQRTRKKDVKTNWYSEFIKKPRRERIIWKSKIYDVNSADFKGKTLDDQAQELMDASAESFTTWMNSLGSDNKNDMSKEALKALFNIEGDKNLFASIRNEPKEVKAIAKTVADKWNLPEASTHL